jgi:hypothetical protein
MQILKVVNGSSTKARPPYRPGDTLTIACVPKDAAGRPVQGGDLSRFWYGSMINSHIQLEEGKDFTMKGRGDKQWEFHLFPTLNKTQTMVTYCIVDDVTSYPNLRMDVAP